MAKDFEFLSASSFKRLSVVALESNVKDAVRPSSEGLTVDVPGGISVEILLSTPCKGFCSLGYAFMICDLELNI